MMYVSMRQIKALNPSKIEMKAIKDMGYIVCTSVPVSHIVEAMGTVSALSIIEQYESRQIISRVFKRWCAKHSITEIKKHCSTESNELIESVLNGNDASCSSNFVIDCAMTAAGAEARSNSTSKEGLTRTTCKLLGEWKAKADLSKVHKSKLISIIKSHQ